MSLLGFPFAKVERGSFRGTQNMETRKPKQQTGNYKVEAEAASKQTKYKPKRLGENKREAEAKHRKPKPK